MTIDKILMHPAVSRGMNTACTPAVQELVQLRRARRNVKRAAANMREELAAQGPLTASSRDAGRIVEVPTMPIAERRLRAALAAEGLPDDLRTMIEDHLQAEVEMHASTKFDSLVRLLRLARPLGRMNL